MQSKGAKIGFIVLLIVFGIGAYWFYNYGPFAQINNEAKKAYQNYSKTEATIISQESNGRIGKGANIIWTIQFKNDKGELVTAKMDKNALPSKENGEKLIIYYDVENLNSVTSEEHYNEVMN
ncbi:hypothetical protein [Pedobacter xixiisoli]|uniref:DUF3592 domain-containing protein n=1 Tax=Pedobacter xixiisoli TaxID=1476464 RepID=A0A285ZQ61_9SPHI|nr:hypothetical protein [Pedobacter xixiisoli]SOD11758.1 hypothetical protein SAMN06297358_0319 [Pedobacter xixiisoli]